MRQFAHPAALGSCCAMVGGIAPVRAAEWLITPTYSASADHVDNRRLLATHDNSESAVLAVDLKFEKALEDMQFFLEPRYSFRRFSDHTLGNGDDRSVIGGATWTGERSLLSLTANYWDQSTLFTEVLETGLITGNTHRRMEQLGANYMFGLTERRSLIAQLSYQNVKYYGEGTEFLPGYRYESGSVGERFAFNERGSVSVSAYGSVLQSDADGGSSHSIGLQAELIYQFTERTNLDASLGESSRVLSGKSSNGTDASITLSHQMLLGRLSVAYTRSLFPYGSGFLVERQQYTASFTHALAPTLDTTLSALRFQNNETAVLLRIDRRSYNSASWALNWHPTETWQAGWRIEGVQSQLPTLEGERVRGWNTSVSLVWTPRPKPRSW
jgi:hypothetical protein